MTCCTNKPTVVVYAYSYIDRGSAHLSPFISPLIINIIYPVSPQQGGANFHIVADVSIKCLAKFSIIGCLLTEGLI